MKPLTELVHYIATFFTAPKLSPVSPRDSIGWGLLTSTQRRYFNGSYF